MPSPTTPSELRKLRLSRKWSWAGPAGGIACMIVLFVAGIVTQTPGMTVIAASTAAALGGAWATVNASLNRKISQAQQR